jgi:hypothetical protein
MDRPPTTQRWADSDPVDAPTCNASGSRSPSSRQLAHGMSLFQQSATATHLDTSRANYCLPRPALCGARCVRSRRVERSNIRPRAPRDPRASWASPTAGRRLWGAFIRSAIRKHLICSEDRVCAPHSRCRARSNTKGATVRSFPPTIGRLHLRTPHRWVFPPREMSRMAHDGNRLPGRS